MDIKIVYPAEQPAETDFLSGQSFAYEAFGHLVHDLLGAGPYVAGLACTPTGPASMSVNVGPGRIYSLQQLRPTALGQVAGLGGLPADTNTDHSILKQGLLRDTTLVGGGGLPFTAPGTTGQSINYLIQAAFVEQDSTASQLRTFYNTQNPDVAIPSNVAEFRQNILQLSVKAGSPATTGSQVTPTADTGNVPVWIVTVAYGQTSITSGNITQHPSAPYSSLVGSGAGLATVNTGVVTVLAAVAADLLAATSTSNAVTPKSLADAQAFGSLTDASTIAWEIATKGIDASVTLTANAHQIGAPTLNGGALYDGCALLLELVQDATGGRTVTWNSVWDFGLFGTPSLNTGANKRTWVQGVYRSATSKIHVNSVWRSA